MYVLFNYISLSSKIHLSCIPDADVLVDSKW